jgi:DNA-binding MarR family transcriptional regulator
MTDIPAGNNPAPSEIKKFRNTLWKTHLIRLAGLADVIDRFIDIQLKNRVNWLKTFSLIILIFEGGRLTPGELGHAMHRSKENMTKVIDALVKEGLVKRYRGGKDRRNVRIKITPEGINYMKQILKEIKKEENLVRSWFTPSELEAVDVLLFKFSSFLKED